MTTRLDQRQNVASVVATLAVLLVSGCDFSMPGPGTSDWVAEIDGEFLMTRSSADMIDIIWQEANKSIPAKITALDWDEDYLLAKQGRTTGGEHPEVVDNEFSYWIAERQNKKLHGPLTLEEFGEARQQFSISNTLGMTPVNELFTTGRLRKRE